eukprot:CAMPEP_0168564270 /NCGR_PEP_ID=MMETSP0413-20121227/13150_1 /TAXON_ID=136452 /ORGANISM="Filamoeba nolandi, Strain NC-AS-23-1" /LENGTH=652 /DNA_ID=CAMNT_0008595919 /DNA_START=708 /DNA_END=2666 /DNA_ORIENTATION=-
MEWKKVSFGDAFRKTLKILGKKLSSEEWRDFILEWMTLSDSELLKKVKKIWKQLMQGDPQGVYRVPFNDKKLLLNENHQNMKLVPNFCFLDMENPKSTLKSPKLTEGLQPSTVFVDYGAIKEYKTFSVLGEGKLVLANSEQYVLITPTNVLQKDQEEEQAWALLLESHKLLDHTTNFFFYRRRPLALTDSQTMQPAPTHGYGGSDKRQSKASGEDNNTGNAGSHVPRQQYNFNNRQLEKDLLRLSRRDNGGDPPARDNNNFKYGEKPPQLTYHQAAMVGHLKRVKQCLEDCEINEKDDLGNGALHYAASFGQHRVLEYLLKTGADPRIRNKIDQTPMHKACQKADGLSCFLLHSYRADAQAVDHFGAKVADEASEDFQSQFQQILEANVLVQPAALLVSAVTYLTIYTKFKLNPQISIKLDYQPLEPRKFNAKKFLIRIPPQSNPKTALLSINGRVKVPIPVLETHQWKRYVSQHTYAVLSALYRRQWESTIPFWRSLGEMVWSFTELRVQKTPHLFFVISIANAIALYGATLTGWTNEVATAYGIYSDPRFLRTVGLFLGIFAYLNYMMALFGAVSANSLALANTILILHYMLEIICFSNLSNISALALIILLYANTLLFVRIFSQEQRTRLSLPQARHQASLVPDKASLK